MASSNFYAGSCRLSRGVRGVPGELLTKFVAIKRRPMRDQDAAARAAIFEDDVAALRAALRRGANVNGMVAGQGAGTDGMP